MKITYLVILLLSLLSCGIVDDDNIKEAETLPKEFSTTSLKYFMNLQTITRDNAISPDYVSRLDSANNSSIGFHCDVKHLYTKEVSRVRVKVKYYFPGPGTASVVCSVSKGDSIVFWSGVPLDQSVAIKKWATSEVNFDFLKTYKDDEVLSVYVWAPNRDQVYIQDLYVNPRK